MQDIKKVVDKRTCGYRRRLEATTKSTNHLEDMVKRALTFGIKADYILMDSWFCWPKILAQFGTHLLVICMAKDMPKVLYRYEGQKLRLSALY